MNNKYEYVINPLLRTIITPFVNQIISNQIKLDPRKDFSVVPHNVLKAVLNNFYFSTVSIINNLSKTLLPYDDQYSWKKEFFSF